MEFARIVHHLDGYPPRGPVDVHRFLAPAQQLAAWVAEIGPTVAGHVALHATSADVTMALAARETGLPVAGLAVVARLLVDPTARRRGVGRALLESAAGGAWDRGRRPILDVATHLSDAIALYESCRWERVGDVTMSFPGEASVRCHVYVGPGRRPACS